MLFLQQQRALSSAQQATHTHAKIVVGDNCFRQAGQNKRQANLNPKPFQILSPLKLTAKLKTTRARQTPLSLKHEGQVGSGVFLWAEEVAFLTALFIVLHRDAVCRPDDPKVS